MVSFLPVWRCSVRSWRRWSWSCWWRGGILCGSCTAAWPRSPTTSAASTATRPWTWAIWCTSYARASRKSQRRCLTLLFLFVFNVLFDFHPLPSSIEMLLPRENMFGLGAVLGAEMANVETVCFWEVRSSFLFFLMLSIFIVWKAQGPCWFVWCNYYFKVQYKLIEMANIL